MKYFWFWDPKSSWPPDAVLRPSELQPGERLNIVCTQTNLPAAEQRAIVREWCDVLPTLSRRFVWFTSRVPQPLFDATCEIESLEGLSIKWSGVTSIERLTRATRLTHFELGQSSRLESIDVLTGLTRLTTLGLELISKVRHLDPLSNLVQLEQLLLEGSIGGTPWRVETLDPLAGLVNLRFLSIAALRPRSKTLSPLFGLSKLEVFHHGTWWNGAELDEIRRRNPKLVA